MNASVPVPEFPNMNADAAVPSRYATRVGFRPIRSTSHAALK